MKTGNNNNMKVFSLALKATDGSNKRALYTCTKAMDISDAINKSIAETSAVFGDLGWTVELQNTVDVVAITIPVHEEDETKFSKNFLLNTIVTYLDRKLFNASKKYLTKSEVAYVESKIKLK